MARQRARARERDRARRRAVAQRRAGRGRPARPHRRRRRPAPPTQLTFEIGTTLDEIELRVIRETLRHTKGDKSRGRAAARHLDAHHLPQARRRARSDDRGLTLCRSRRASRPARRQAVESRRSRCRETSCIFERFPRGTSLAHSLTGAASHPMAIDKLLKRHFWAVILAARRRRGVLRRAGDHARRRRQPRAPTRSSSPRRRSWRACPRRPASASPHATNAEPILARNPFDSVTGPLNARRRGRGRRAARARPRST